MRWQEALKSVYQHPSELLDALEIYPYPDYVDQKKRSFGMLVTRSFAKRMKKGDTNDPLLIQVLPTHAENTPQVGFQQAPLQEDKAMPIPGCMHKYHHYQRLHLYLKQNNLISHHHS